MVSRPRVVPERRLDMREAEAWALASIYERAIERSKQKQGGAEGADGESKTEGGHVGEPPEECTAGDGVSRSLPEVD